MLNEAVFTGLLNDLFTDGIKLFHNEMMPNGRSQHNSFASKPAGDMRTEEPFDAADIYDMYSSNFNATEYVSRVIKESSLDELVTTETTIKTEIRRLNSEMQTLVYENYNKFISATDTVKKMKNDFKVMEDEMERLADNMQKITASSSKVSSALQDRRAEINKLSKVDETLKKLQFLFELPAKLKEAVEKGNYRQAADYYSQSQNVLEQYCHLPSLQGLQKESADCVQQLTAALQARLLDTEMCADRLTEAVSLLIQLGQPADLLTGRVLDNADVQLARDLQLLADQLELVNGAAAAASGKLTDRMRAPADILEFMDIGCNNFISNLCLFINSYNNLFMKDTQSGVGDATAVSSVAADQLVAFYSRQLQLFLQLVGERLDAECADTEPVLLARALDKLQRRLAAVSTVLPSTDCTTSVQRVIEAAVERRCQLRLRRLTERLAASLQDIRQQLAAAGRPAHAPPPLAELLAALIGTLAEQTRTAVTSLQAFVRPELSFCVDDEFRAVFSRRHVREGVLVAYFRHLMSVCRQLCANTAAGSSSATPRVPPNVLILLCKACRDLETSTVHYLLNHVDSQLQIEEKTGLTPFSEITLEMRSTAQLLVDNYVRLQGAVVSQMLRKSVETRDWLHTVEPRSVRSVMKRVVEELSLIDASVGQLFEEGNRRERSSDSSRRTFISVGQRSQRRDWSSFTAGHVDSNLAANIQKLFSERIEIFSPVDFTKVSILTGIVKISLKTLLECVRLQTFSQFGLQQIQVDVHYLQINLWRFISDDKLLHALLDEVLGSALHRCLNPVLMEFSVVEALADRG